MVAGGLGIVPVYFLTCDLLRQKHCGKIYFLYGAKEKEQLYCMSDLKLLKDNKVEILYSTDDGSYGFKGYLDQLLKEVLKKEAKGKVKIYACGPEPLLVKLSQLAKAENLFCQLSLELGMPCGMGTCMGCVVKYKSAKGGSAPGGQFSSADFQLIYIDLTKPLTGFFLYAMLFLLAYCTLRIFTASVLL